MADRFLRATSDAGPIYACISDGARFVVPEVGPVRLTASLHPYPDEASGRAALIAAGGRGVEWEARR